MAVYTYDKYVYFNNMTDKPKKYDIGFILNQSHNTYITSPLKIMEEIFVSLPNIFISKKDRLMNANIQIISQSSKVNLQDKHIQQMGQMYNGREKLINILTRADF